MRKDPSGRAAPPGPRAADFGGRTLNNFEAFKSPPSGGVVTSTTWPATSCSTAAEPSRARCRRTTPPFRTTKVEPVNFPAWALGSWLEPGRQNDQDAAWTCRTGRLGGRGGAGRLFRTFRVLSRPESSMKSGQSTRSGGVLATRAAEHTRQTQCLTGIGSRRPLARAGRFRYCYSADTSSTFLLKHLIK